MKEIREFMDGTEAQMAKAYLRANGIDSELEGTKDYSTHIVGGTQGRYHLLVADTDQTAAEKLLRMPDLQLASQMQRPTLVPEVALKKSVMFAFIAIVLLPWIGNWISVMQAIRYARLERNPKKWYWLFLISWLQVPGVIVGASLIGALFQTRIVDF